MAKVSKEKLIGDVILQLTQAAPSQDLELESKQVAFWLTNARNEIVAQEVAQALRKGNQPPVIYVTRETCKALTEEDIACVDELNQRMSFNLSQEVVDVDDDGGIVQVLTNELDEIFKGSNQLMPMFKAMRYTTPSSQLLIWYRQGDPIFVEGFKQSDLDFNEIIVFYVPKVDIESLADTDTVSITDALLPILIEKAVELGKLELYGTQSDMTNNATQDITPVYHRQIQQPTEQPQE